MHRKESNFFKVIIKFKNYLLLRKKIFLFSSFFLLFSTYSFSMDSMAILPNGIYSTGWKQGQIINADQKFTSQGELYSLSDLNSIEFNVEKLKTIVSYTLIIIAFMSTKRNIYIYLLF